MHYSEIAQKYRVTAGFLAALYFLYRCRPTWESFLIGATISLLGIALRFWAAGYLQKAQKLTTVGPYGYTRNPLYLGSFVLLLGFVIAGGNLVAAIIILALFAAIYFPTMRREEIELRNGFHEEFDRYAAAVPMFLPRWSRYPTEHEPFRLSQVWRNREHNSLLGCGIGLLLIYLKLRMFT